ncbi:class I tRNA ligase family protein [Candidatus Parcubacteria bacterium]|jgi:leucyl-tRNA synthetase|nr:class I tRNA ligase family protein [Candidatus Parcubacteria bacterium]MBT7227951.1 class I tRNA ligase family protein [Candidatus Parcubacteria bacterium]
MVKKTDYNPNRIDAKWQKFWDKNKTYTTPDKKGDNFYALVEFPYPSGDGLHTGHLRSYTALDVISRKKRMEGKNVLYPMGFDAFGLPAENFAIKTNTAPEITTKKNIANYISQMKSVGLSFDWDRGFSTTDPDYYRWTQWIFIQMFKKGLAYKSVENINWCNSCKIGLANEEVVAGVCERCGGEVVKKEKEQWMLKITEYADRLIDGLDNIDFLESIKKQQKDWIGKSEGAEVDFKIKDTKETLKVFTTRPDTLFGATFMVLAPEHPNVHALEGKISNLVEVKKYISHAKKKTDEERGAEDKPKTGVELEGIKAINPVNNEEIPIFVADYIMMGYGTGAIMAVPGHDQRDYDFAKKYNLEIREVIEPLFSKNEGKDAFREDEKIIERDAAVCVVKHWKEDRYICLQWKNVDWHGLIVGGIKDGEDAVEAAKREIEEETGYASAKFVKELGGKIHAQFYQTLKKENRRAHFHGLYFELEDDKNVGISEKEQAIHDVKWIDKDQVESFLNVPDMKLMWRRLHECEAYSGDGIAVNSGEFDGLETLEFKQKITKWLEKNKVGKSATNYKLHDWIFSRQRYWGEPIPMIKCTECGWLPVPDDELPVTLPKVDDFKPGDDGESPLAKMISWVNTTCPKCGKFAKRETDVMPNWAGSNWYFIRFCDPKNSQELVDKEKAEMWLPVDWYNGGMEHTTLHLLYSRFVFKFLFDIGAVPKSIGDEPYKKRTAQGMILGEGGIKMSKSKGNVINPDDYVAKYGADTLRVYEMFMGPFDQSIAWDDKGVKGVHKFLNKAWSLQYKVGKSDVDQGTLHKSIKKVSEDIDNMRFNTAISQLMILSNELDKQSSIPKDIFEKFVLILSPFAPHLAEELWNSLGHKDSLAHEKWPKYDGGLAKDDSIVIGIQINGKVRDEIELPTDTEPSKEIEKQILSQDKVKKHIGDKKIVKFIHIKNKIISIVVK